VIRGRALVPGSACGELLILSEPLSFWGGFDATSGRITDRHHPQCGVQLTHRVVVLPGLRGSTSSASVLAEAIRLDTGPAALGLVVADVMAVVAGLVAAELYGRVVPIVQLAAAQADQLRDGTRVRVTPDGSIAEVD
jgi:predicted aconitase with swiveling domain